MKNKAVPDSGVGTVKYLGMNSAKGLYNDQDHDGDEKQHGDFIEDAVKHMAMCVTVIAKVAITLA